MSDERAESRNVYCVVCEELHRPPVAIAVNDKCPLNERLKVVWGEIVATYRGGGIMGKRRSA